VPIDVSGWVPTWYDIEEESTPMILGYGHNGDINMALMFSLTPLEQFNS
jgi:hypothetical protein